jgi:hypothetical protein
LYGPERVVSSLSRSIPSGNNFVSTCPPEVLRAASRFSALLALRPATPSTVYTRGVKSFRISRQLCRYLLFFSFSCRARSLGTSTVRWAGASDLSRKLHLERRVD